MDVKQNHHGNNKSILPYGSIKRLIYFVHNLEDKLSSVKTIHEKLHELISIVSKTHENILDELITIKNVINQQKQHHQEIIEIDENKSEWDEEDDEQPQQQFEEQQGQLIDSTKKFESKSETNLSMRDQQRNILSNQQINSPSSRPTDRLSLSSASSLNSSSTNSSTIENRPNSSTSKRSSNLKKSDQSSTRAKSPKSVSFHFEENNNSINDKQQIVQPNLEYSNETNKTFNQITTPIILNSNNQIFRQNSDLIPDLFKQHHNEVTSKPNIGYKLGNALTNVRIHEIESKAGDYLRLLNISNSDDYDLSGHFLQQNIACVPLCRFRFPYNTIIRAGQTVTVWCGSSKDIEPQPPHIFLWKEQRQWQTGPECVTILAKPNGQAIAWARSSNRVNTDQSSSDILFIHSKTNNGTSDAASISSNPLKSYSRLSAFNFIGNNKPPFAHSPSNPVHPDHNGPNSNIPNDLRSQMHQRGGLSHLLNRPKSSPFASHVGCKQDIISMNILRKQQTTQGQKQTTLKT